MEMLLPFPDRAASDAWIARMQAHFDKHRFCQWAVEIPGEASLIGAVGLNWVSHQTAFTPAVEMGWRLARPYWGQGYAFEAAQAVIDDGFGRLGLDVIVAYTVPANRRSWGLMERLGMSRDPSEGFRSSSRSRRAPAASSCALPAATSRPLNGFVFPMEVAL